MKVSEFEPVDLAVIGGGVAGLLAARTAARAGARVAVLEAATSIGGLVGAHDVGGIRLDSAAESFATRGGHVAELATALGLEVVTPDPTPARVLHEGRLMELPATGVLGIPTDLDAPGLADVLGREGLARARQDAHLPVGESETTTAQPTLAELVTSRMGPAVLEALVRPIVRGVHSNEPEQVSAEGLLPGIMKRLHEHGSLAAALAAQRAAAPAGSAVAGIDGGVHRLPLALARDITTSGGQIFTASPVEEMRPGSGEGSRQMGDLRGNQDEQHQQMGESRWHLGGRGWKLTADRVILACPPHTWRFLPNSATGADKNADNSAEHGELPLMDLATVAGHWPEPRPIDLLTLVLRADRLPAHHRAGTLVAEPGLGAKALTYMSSKWDWVAREARTSKGQERVVLRLSYQAGVLPEVSTSDAGRGALADYGLRDAARLTGTEAPWPAGALEELAHTRLHRPAPVSANDRESMTTVIGTLDGIAVTGAWWAGSGIAAVADHARWAATELLSAPAERLSRKY